MITLNITHLCPDCRVEHKNWILPGKGTKKVFRGAIWEYGEEPIKNKCDACGQMMIGNPVLEEEDDPGSDNLGKFYLMDVR